MTEVLVCDHFLILQLNLCTGLFSSFPVSPLSQHVPRKPEFLLVCVCESLSCVRLFATPWTIQSMEFSRLEYWSGNLSLLQGIFPTQGSNPGLPHYGWILSHKGGPFRREWYLEAKKHSLRVLSPSGILLLLNFSHGQLGNVCVCMCVCVCV